MTQSHRNRYSPSAIRAFEDLCPAALDFYQARSPQMTDLYDVGTAAHAFLEGLALATADKKHALEETEVDLVITNISRTLMAGSWRGQNHPIAPADVYEALGLAVNWYNANPFDSGDIVETGAAFDASWKRTKWESDQTRYRLVFDLVRLYDDGDEEESFTVAEATDYKTAWNTNADQLAASIQMQSQALALSLLYPGREVYRIRLVNLRTARAFSLDYRADEIEPIRARVESAMTAADEPRKHRVGAQCLACPYVTACPAAKAALEANGLTADIPALAESFVVARAIAKRTEKLLRAHTNEHGNIALHGGFIGYRASQSTKCPPEKAVALFADWTNRGGSANSFLIAMKGIGASQLDAIGKTIFKGRGAPALREEWASPFVEIETKAKWSVHTSNGDETTDEE